MTIPALDPASPTPLWAQLRELLRTRILVGEWPPGEMIPKESELCDQYGVSRITSARAIHELVRDGLLQRYRGRGTVVTGPERRSDAESGPRALAFVAPRLDHDWTLDIFRGFESVLTESGYLALLSSTSGRPDLVGARLEALLEDHAQGLAITQLRLSPETRALLPELRRRGVPLVCIGTYDPDLECDRVVADNPRAGRLAVEHLLRLGHRRIAFFGPGDGAIAGPNANTSVQGRLDGYRAAMRAAYDAGDVSSAPGALDALEALELLDTLPQDLDDTARTDRLLGFLDRTEATAAVATTDSLAVLVMRYIRPAGLRVPEHLALVGISDARLAALVDVPLTTVRIEAADLGMEAARLLVRRLEGDTSPPREVVLPVQLVVRASCGARTGSEAADPYEPADATRDALAAFAPALGS